MNNQAERENDRSLCLVSGYHDWTELSREAYEAGLRHRFAVVLDSYRCGNPDMYFDAELFVRLAEAISRVVGYDSVQIRMNDNTCLDSFAELAALYARQEEVDQLPPERTALHCEGRLVCLGEAESWWFVGGPEPYHDSYTVSFYTRTNQARDMRGVCEAICEQLDAEITGFFTVEASKLPRPYQPWWQRIGRSVREWLIR